MKVLDIDLFSAAKGDRIRITVTSVNFVNNAQLDTRLSPVAGIPDTDFTKVREFIMGDADDAVAVSYGFPDSLPAGARYTRTVTGPAAFIDGPFEVNKPSGGTLVALGYTFRLAAATAGAPQPLPQPEGEL